MTVCGATCLAADVAAKAAFLLGGDGPDWLDAHGLPAPLRRRDGETIANEAWRRSRRGDAACT